MIGNAAVFFAYLFCPLVMAFIAGRLPATACYVKVLLGFVTLGWIAWGFMPIAVIIQQQLGSAAPETTMAFAVGWQSLFTAAALWAAVELHKAHFFQTVKSSAA